MCNIVRFIALWYKCVRSNTELVLYKGCWNLSGGVALIVWFTTNGMCAKNKNICMWHEQAIIEWSRRVISIAACCHGAKFCAHAARDFRSQQNGAVTRMWRSCYVQPSHKERAIGVVRCKKEGMLLQTLRWRCVECVIHHERDVREEQKYVYVARTSNNRVISSGDLYCCLLPRCEALRTCRSGFPIATLKIRISWTRWVASLGATLLSWKSWWHDRKTLFAYFFYF